MKYARIEITKKRWEMREKSVPIVIFSQYRNVDDDLVYAPKSRIIVEKEWTEKMGGVENEFICPKVQILVPAWVFVKNGVNAWNADTFIEFVEK